MKKPAPTKWTQTFKNYKRPARGPMGVAYGFLNAAMTLVLEFPESKDDQTNLLMVNNFVVNVATGYEIYFKALIIDNNNWRQAGIRKLLNAEIHLDTAYELFHNAKVTREFIVSQSNNFQNFDEIEKVMCALTGNVQFFQDVENFVLLKLVDEKTEPPLPLKTAYPKWRTIIKNIFKIRHKFVHNGDTSDLDYDTVTEMHEVTMWFLLSVGEFCLTHFPMNKIKTKTDGRR